MGAIVPRSTYDVYSVDSSVMIDLRETLPFDIFQPAWEEIERLVVEDRWKIFEHVANEVTRKAFKDWLRRNPSACAPFDEQFNEYLNCLMREFDRDGIRMINPAKTKDGGDPFVIALALYLEGRNCLNLRDRTGSRTCCVLTNESRRETARNIPYVCERYGLAYMNHHEFMRHHGWKFTLKVEHLK